jgi:hypothetical protein
MVAALAEAVEEPPAQGQILDVPRIRAANASPF